MYHCHLRFYFTGHVCNVFEIIKKLSPLEHFSHEFSESESPDKNLTEQGDVIFANIEALDVGDTLQTLTGSMRKDTHLILLAKQNQIACLLGRVSLSRHGRSTLVQHCINFEVIGA